jgi:tetratricopeptide (TPR) repeat protein
MINQKLGDLDGEAKSLGYIGAALVKMGKLDDATIAYEERIALAQKLNDHRGKAKGNWNLGKVLIQQRNYSAGLEYLYKCVEYEKSAGDPAWEDDLKVIKRIEAAFDGAD